MPVLGGWISSVFSTVSPVCCSMRNEAKALMMEEQRSVIWVYLTWGFIVNLFL